MKEKFWQHVNILEITKLYTITIQTIGNYELLDNKIAYIEQILLSIVSYKEASLFFELFSRMTFVLFNKWTIYFYSLIKYVIYKNLIIIKIAIDD